MSRSAAAGVAALLLLAVAAAQAGPARADPTLAPGAELTRVTLPEDLRSDIELMDVAASDAGWVAVGYRRGGTPGAAALFSPDGLSWSAASVVGELEGSVVSRVTAVGSGFVATGVPGALWVSPDGRSWESRPLDPPLDHAFLFDLASHDGVLFAVGCGWAGGEQECKERAAWRSDDLRTMEPLLALEGQPTGIGADAQGVMVVGWRGRTVEGGFRVEGWSAWTTDEDDWTFRDLGPGSAVLSVARESDGWIAVGRRDERMLLARSTDGLGWTDVLTTPPEGSAVFATSSGPLTVVAGCTGEAPVCPSELWRLEPDGALIPLRLGGIEAGGMVEISALALAPDGGLLVVGDVAQGLDGPEESTLWWSGSAGPGENT